MVLITKKNWSGGWGTRWSITGTLSDQTDLQAELDSKLEEVDTNDIVNHAVTNTKLAQMNANTVKGRLSWNWTPQDIAMANLPISTATQTALNSKLWETFETVSKNLKGNQANFFYTWDKLTSIVYSNGITKTLNYTGDKLTSIVLSWTTPSWINLTKTLNYTWDTLAWYSYS
jgi:hypothetical protein